MATSRPKLTANQVLNSISSLTSLIAFTIVMLSIFQASTANENWSLPKWLNRINLKDVDTIRTMLSAVIGGVFTLTIFSYTMVMSVMNRAIANYTPRLLPLLLSQRYHQIMLGVAVGTIAHAIVMLLSTQSLEQQPNGPPILAAAISGLLAIISLGLFIHFIHSVSQSMHVNTLLRTIHDNTRKNITAFHKKYHKQLGFEVLSTNEYTGSDIKTDVAGYLYEIDYKKLAEIAKEENSDLLLVATPSSFVTQNELLISSENKLSDDCIENCRDAISVTAEVPTEEYFTGFKQLTEVAVKACSPAINDPGTALTALDYYEELLIELNRLLPIFNKIVLPDSNSGLFISSPWTVRTIHGYCYPALEKYLNDDPWTKKALADANQRIRSLSTFSEKLEFVDLP